MNIFFLGLYDTKFKIQNFQIIFWLKLLSIYNKRIFEN
ncbi:hypothetical protein LEP1GSC166_1385 [Leptospira kirschneri]|uniref:Uncharacterized protein n=2 Tax=Leptospira kirschneri TaxID=29507 RepID=A0A0E2B1S2_9LEPT|nr:hypothetical protein LEP1GSC081_0982 [Leptospira kirschneri str. H1]EMJ93714.1 hypothetical protein LEP1GSC198_1538 [Leptospira kirschneri str. JB]EMK11058.1 hypothetical protein LEP1GSC166_1385 [Leptospira kirschneri]EMK20238.1 hypothetical protein LEP1GSC008_2778 [Leptospira kirschneri serovar Bulgarica str. Nikolaevo]